MSSSSSSSSAPAPASSGGVVVEDAASKKKKKEEEEEDNSSVFFTNALKQEILHQIVTTKANACPMGVRLAWHSSGTYDETKEGCPGGSNGATMRFEPESVDDANAGLGIMRDLMLPVKRAYPSVSCSDIWALCGAASVEYCGGPKIPVALGRVDADEADAEKRCPENGRLPDASLGADHLRQIFGRMGFDDREIVALSGAHTLGRCHRSRSGYDGPWTFNPLQFDNTYYRLLLEKKWKPRDWDGPLQYENESDDDDDEETDNKLMMLPTDMCLLEDASFKTWVERYASDPALFRDDFRSAFHKLLHLGCPVPSSSSASADAEGTSSERRRERAAASFREHAMHGSMEHCRRAILIDKDGKDDDDDDGKYDVEAARMTEGRSNRTALHKASFWGHDHLVEWLAKDLGIDVDARDCEGDTALHDAARFGHMTVVQRLLTHGADPLAKNRRGQTPLDVARQNDKSSVVQLVQAWDVVT